MGLACKILGHKVKWVEEERFLEEDEEPAQAVEEGIVSGDNRKVQIRTPVCERCGEDLSEEYMKKRLRQCGYCGGFDEAEDMSTHGYFGKVCRSCASHPRFWEMWTESGDIVGMDICPECGSKMKFETLGTYEEPGIGQVTETRYHCPKCRLENLGYM